MKRYTLDESSLQNHNYSRIPEFQNPEFWKSGILEFQNDDFEELYIGQKLSSKSESQKSRIPGFQNLEFLNCGILEC